VLCTHAGNGQLLRQVATPAQQLLVGIQTVSTTAVSKTAALVKAKDTPANNKHFNWNGNSLHLQQAAGRAAAAQPIPQLLLLLLQLLAILKLPPLLLRAALIDANPHR
jgi:hypothetical protein